MSARDHSPQSRKDYKRLQRHKKRYMELREELQLAGEIPTEPVGAIRDERVQTSDPLEGLPELVRQSLRKGWATPEDAKAVVVGKLLRPFFNDVEMIDKDGNLVSVPTPPKLLNELAKTIQLLDQTQYERDNPEAAGKAKGGTVAVSVEANTIAVNVLRGMFENELGGGQTALPTPVDPNLPGPGRFDGDVETGAVSTEEEWNGDRER